MIRILQISDIHFKKFDNTVDEYAEMRQRVKDCVEDYCKTANLDCLMICGDIAFSGNAYEYENKAKPFIADLLGIMNAGQDRVYMVPGNHDKNRSADGRHTRAFLRDGLLHDKQADFVLDNIKRDEQETMKALYKPFHDYMEFANDYDSLSDVAKKMLADDRIGFSDMMYRAYELGKLGDYAVVLYGINSCLASDDMDDKEHNQALPKQTYNIVQERKVINISMMHHPMKFINKGLATIEKELDDKYVVQFYGHEHIESFEKGDAIKIFSGALQPDYKTEEDKKVYRPVFNIIEMDVNGDVLSVVVRPYIWTWDEPVPTFKKESPKTYTHNLTAQRNATKARVVQQLASLPEGVTVRDVKIRVVRNPHYLSIIKDVYADFQTTGDKGKDCIKFFERVTTDHKYSELHNILSKYER